MNVTFVTALLLPADKQTARPLDVYFKEFEYLATTGVPLHVYLDEDYPGTIPGAERTHVNRDDLPESPVLPSNRKITKDTTDYMCIQAMKLDLVARAAKSCTTPYLAWIDFGVFHMMTDKPAAQERLREIAVGTYLTDRLIAPGCWGPGDYGVDSVCWRFCGSFVLGHRDLFAPAYERQQAIARSIAPKITWEVNLWSYMDEFFHVYPADHNDLLLRIPNNINARSGETVHGVL